MHGRTSYLLASASLFEPPLLSYTSVQGVNVDTSKSRGDRRMDGNRCSSARESGQELGHKSVSHSCMPAAKRKNSVFHTSGVAGTRRLSRQRVDLSMPSPPLPPWPTYIDSTMATRELPDVPPLPDSEMDVDEEAKADEKKDEKKESTPAPKDDEAKEPERKKPKRQHPPGGVTPMATILRPCHYRFTSTTRGISSTGSEVSAMDVDDENKQLEARVKTMRSLSARTTIRRPRTRRSSSRRR